MIDHGANGLNGAGLVISEQKQGEGKEERGISFMQNPP
ncbi:MAG: hypothetical protein QOH35_4132 [Acidobacteriaceae bacterium]|jgi:hypothetical protein|nr:hypothetical protein [Acidobacteriaceae bacterium]